MLSEKGSSTPLKCTKNNLDLFSRNAPEGLTILPDANWSRFSSLGAGTAPFVLAVASGIPALRALTDFAGSHAVRLFPLGGGTNIIGSDVRLTDQFAVKLGADGEFGCVEQLAPGRFRCGGAVMLRSLLDFARSAGYGGASALSGIPGTVGGCVVMNAGACGRQIGDFLREVELYDLHDGSVRTVNAECLNFAYRFSSVRRNEMVLSAVFEFVSCDPEQEKQCFQAEALRRGCNPKGRSSGSVFQNPLPERAGRLLDRAGLRGWTCGAFAVAAEHANWIVNRGGAEPARESDYLRTFQQMKSAVQLQTGIVLKPEVRFFSMSTEENVKTMCAPLKVLVLKGGVSSERPISLESAANVAKNLRAAGHDVREYDITELKVTPDMSGWADVVYPVLHGGFGEDGRLQKMLEDASIPFVGISSRASEIVMDKVASKKIMKENGITTADYAVVTSSDAAIPQGMKLPLIVKPASEGSTFGLTLVENESEWKNALELAFRYDQSVLVESFIQGIESTVGILLGQALPLVEIRYPGKLYDYDAKYTHAHGETKYICPPTGISVKAQENAKREAETFARAVNGEALLRVDVIITPDDRAYVLEGNSMPGCTASSLLPKAALAVGISGPEMCSRLAYDGWKRSRK